MYIKMRDIADSDVLAGALRGRKSLSILLEQIDKEPTDPEPVYLDFTGITVATASFLRESVLEFRYTVRRRWTGYYPIVANANDTITEELSVLVEPQRDVLLLCTLSDDGIPSEPRLVGELEPKQQITFDLVKELGETDARELVHKTSGTEEVGQTAWSNRLASLSKLGILMVLSHGRAKRFRPLLLED